MGFNLGNKPWNKGTHISPPVHFEKGHKKLGGVKKGIRSTKSWKEIGKVKRIKARMRLVKSLGGKCVHCGFDDFRALQVDHINGDGKCDRKTVMNPYKFYLKVEKSFFAKENKYQLLCANCNWIKKYVNNENCGKFR